VGKVILLGHAAVSSQLAPLVATLEAEGHEVEVTDNVPQEPEPIVFKLYPMPEVNWPPAAISPSKRGRGYLRGNQRPWKKL
jgi:hypothetical protein